MPATTAYRRDAAAGRSRENDAQGTWVALGVLLEQAAEAPPKAARRYVETAASLARRSVGATQLREQARAEWGRTAQTSGEIIFLYCVAAERAGLFELADAVIQTAERVTVFSAIERARFAVLRARIARRLDRLDFAEDGYRAVWRQAQKLGSAELKARASLGLGALAQSRGNYPQFLKYNRRALKHAREAGACHIEHEAHMGFVTIWAMRRHFDRAIEAAWAMLACSEHYATDGSRDLATLAQLLIEMNRPEVATKVLSRIFIRPSPPAVFIAALGSLAVASAGCGDVKVLDWAIEQIDTLRTSIVPRLEYVGTLLDAASSLHVIGRAAAARTYRDSALRLAIRYQLHEYVMRAEALELTTPTPAPVIPIRGGAVEIIRSIGGWPVSRLPRRARMAHPLAAR